MLLWMSSDGCGRWRVGECPIDLSGDVAFETADDLAFGQTFVGASLDIGLRAGIVAHPGQSDHIESVVRLPVTAPVETMTVTVPTPFNRTTAGAARATNTPSWASNSTTSISNT
jgi:hypothetical protein